MSEEMWRELNELKLRVETLEASLKRRSDSPLASSSQDNSILAASAPASTPAASIRRQQVSGQPSDLETRIGAQIFNRVGVFAVLAAAAWFLKLAIDRSWIGPGVRVTIGLLVAAGLIAWSERFRRSGSVTFSNTLKALGAGIAYLSLWASVNLYQLLPPLIAFIAMVIVTVTNAVLAWRQDSELLAALALAGGLITPALLSNGGDQEMFLFAYLLLLDIGILALIALRPWPRLAIGAFAGTTTYFGVWWLRFHNPSNQILTGVFIALIFAAFTSAPVLALWRQRSTRIPASDGLLAGLPVAVGICAFLEMQSLLTSFTPETQTSWVAGVLGATYLALTIFLPSNAMPARSLAKPVRVIHLSLAISSFALAGWLQFHGYGIAVSWLTLLLVVCVAGARFSSSQLAKPLRGNASAVLLLSFCALLLLDVYDPQAAGTGAFLNPHFAVYLAGLAAFAAVVALGRSRLGSEPPFPTLAVDSWVFISGFATVAFNIVALLAVGIQIELYWRRQLNLAQGNLRVFHHPAYVDFTYSAWFMLYGAALMAAGFLKRSAFLRWQALSLLSLSVAKVFLFDVSHLNEGYRVSSFLGLGVLLLATSFAYQRDWLGLRESRR